jgi:antitoxin CcdA
MQNDGFTVWSPNVRSFRNAPKRSIHLTLNARVLNTAKALGMNVSQTLDCLLEREVTRLYWQRWSEDNADAIAHYNARIEREGLFSDRHRTFMRDAKTSS